MQHETPSSGLPEPQFTAEAVSLPALQFDPEEYRQFVDEADLSEAQKQEMLEALWTIIVAFVDLGFNLHPVQQALNVHEIDHVLGGDSAAVITCKDSVSDHKNIAAAKRLKKPAAGRTIHEEGI
jgi:hypothetical protein